MKKFTSLLMSLLLVSQGTFAAKIQQQGIKTATDCTNAGASLANCLPLDSQIYVTGNNINQPLSTAISNGLIGGGGSGKDYLSGAANGNFEQGTTAGWSLGHVSLTNGLPSGSPTFGSGAAGTLSLTSISSGQLSKNYSLGYVSSAATTAGDMVCSGAISIDISDQAKVLALKGNYKAFSGAANMNFSGTSSNSYGVAIYDVTNSAWLGGAGNFSLVQSAGVGSFNHTPQTASNTASIRACIYNATATAGAATLYLDDISFGPQVSVSAPAMSDWTSYTPTFTGFGTPTGVTILYRRVGDTLEIQGQFNAGTVTASTASFSLPSGLVSDLVPGNGFQQIGTWLNNNGSGTTAKAGPLQISNGASVIDFSLWDYTPAISAQTYQNGNVVAGNTNQVQVQAVVKIVGWSSNTVMSNDTDTRVVAAAYSSTSGPSIGNTATVIPFTTKSFDTNGAYNTSTGVYTVPVTGKYRITSKITTSGTILSTAQAIAMNINKNGSAVSSSQIYGNGNGSGPAYTIWVSDTIDCVATDTLSISALSAVATAVNTAAGYSTLSIERLSGPATIAATETVAASVFKTSAQALTDSTSTLITSYDAPLRDTHGAFNSTTGTYTCPVSGTYRVTASTAFVQNSTGYRFNLIALNGSIYQYGAGTTALVTDGTIVAANAILYCNAKDVISQYAWQNSGGSLNVRIIGNATSLHIERIGN